MTSGKRSGSQGAGSASVRMIARWPYRIAKLDKGTASESGLDHNSGIVTRRVSEEMLQVDTRSSLTLRVTMLSLLATAGVVIKAVNRRNATNKTREMGVFFRLVVRGRVELPTHGFSVRCSTN